MGHGARRADLLHLAILRRRALSLLVALLLLTGLSHTVAEPARAEAPVLLVDGTGDRGPAGWRASGFLHADAGDVSRAQALRPRTWRTGGAFAEYTDTYNRAGRHGAKVVWVISDDWADRTGNAPPWEDWAAYEAFVRETVRRHLAEYPVDTWDIQNEPEGFAPRGGTQQDYLDIYLHGYKAIKEVDPGARIIGPSSVRFQPTPYVACDPDAPVKTYECDPLYAPAGRTQYGPKPGAQYLDLQTFLDFAAKPHALLGGQPMRFAQINWHELCIGDLDCNPHRLVEHVALAREMIAARPSLGSPEIGINEYTGYQVTDVPGWIAGYIAALEEADVEQAAKACWHEPSGANQCFDGMLDGLVGRDGTTPRSGYWVYRAYADMVGARVPVTVPTSAQAFSAFATRDDASKELRVLLGRHETTCSAAPAIGCAPRTAPAPGNVAVDVKVPWALDEVAVTLQRLAAPAVNLSSNTSGFQDAGALRLPVVDGIVRVVVSGIGDGDAWQLLVDDDGLAAPSPVSPAPATHCPFDDCGASGPHGAWSATGSMYYARSKAESAVLQDGRVLITGGNAGSESRGWSKVYDPPTGTWTTTGTQAGSAGTPRQKHTATMLQDGRVLASGGMNPFNYSVVNPADVYDPARGTWSKTAALTVPRFDHAAALLLDGRVLVVGGYQQSALGVTASSSAEIYDPAGNGGAGSWTLTAPMRLPRAGATATSLPDGRVLVVGGSPAVGVAAASADIYDPDTGTWSDTGQMHTGRAFHTASLLPTGDVVVVGGGAPVVSGRDTGAELAGQQIPADALITGTAEVFRTLAGVWEPAGSIEARSRHSASTLSDGRVVVTGGIGIDGHLASTYVREVDGAWTEVASLPGARAFHTADVLPGDKLLITGGEDGPMTSADRFAPLFHTFSSAYIWKATRAPKRNSEIRTSP